MGAAFLEPAARHETLYRAKTGTNNQVAPALTQEEQRIHQIFGARGLTCELLKSNMEETSNIELRPFRAADLNESDIEKHLGANSIHSPDEKCFAEAMKEKYWRLLGNA